MKKTLSFIFLLLFAPEAFSQTRNVLVGTNNAVVSPTNFWSADASNARTGLGLGTAATNPSSAFQPSSSNLNTLSANNGQNLTNIPQSGVVGLQSALNEKIGTNSQLPISSIINLQSELDSKLGTNQPAINVSGVVAITNGGTGATNATNARSNLGLGWSALTNSNTTSFNYALYGVGNAPVIYNDSTEIVSTPVNFWNVSPFFQLQTISTTTNATNNVNLARYIFVNSVLPSAGAVTNVLVLPEFDGGSFAGNIATITHERTNALSQTVVRGGTNTNNIVTLTNSRESVDLIYGTNNAWSVVPNKSFVTPIYFSGTSATTNAAISRTNLGLPLPALTNTTAANFRTAIELGATNNVTFSNVSASGTIASTGVLTAITNLNVGGAIFVTNSAETRTNLGIPLAVLTNTNNSSFQASLFQTNTAPTNTDNVNAVPFHAATYWLEVSVVISGVTNSFRIPLFQ